MFKIYNPIDKFNMQFSVLGTCINLWVGSFMTTACLSKYFHAKSYLTGSKPVTPCYCKRGNIRGTLIFADFAVFQQARIQKPAKIFAIFCMHILDT